uniref:NADH-ubiquinone oxidoreductase chain 5 n=1 Tax=Ornithodoros brasiliensis TaxID=888526 RepID=W0FDN7_ORNBR|nr:NADH dehydrogenase subunit 5 [Ornithodoros brasiliensis]AHF21685.1 NADH dehydrogenase subunit 5 [Ornithodoros brasiliensis]QZP40888.1 NADH dehydrogenase subunit 5 [Ornithodoros brasiliensis]
MFFKWGMYLMVVSLFMFFSGILYLYNMKILLIEYFIYVFGNFEIKFYFLFDWMSLMFVSVVMFISSMVIFYSNDYMKFEKFKVWFCYGVLLFVGSMVLLIVSPNLFMILLGWDGLGLVSYCLVIYYQNYKSDSAGMITVLSNRIGDVMILLSMVMLMNFGSLDFLILKKVFFVTGLMMIVAGMTKSAQIPFSAWLPAAMAAPTPVSSLVHSSTLVTAGVYLLIRLNLLFQIDVMSSFLLYFALLTMLMSGLGAIMEMDLKKIIALSTLSQLGLMMLILSVGAVDLSFFHLLSHAIFKAMLFLCAGFMIHGSLGHQDIRFMGIFYMMNPMIGVAFSLANMSLFGIPFLSGFYSKDMILEWIYMMEISTFEIFLTIIATMCTCIYSLRVMYYSMWKGGISMVDFSYHWSFWMEIPIVLMGISVILFGCMMSWLLFPNYEFNLTMLDMKLVNIFIIIFSCWVYYIFYFGKVGLMNFSFFNTFLGSMWFMSFFSSGLLMNKMIYGINFHNFDNSWFEEVGSQGVYKLNVKLSSFISWMQSSELKNLCFFVIIVMLVF